MLRATAAALMCLGPLVTAGCAEGSTPGSTSSTTSATSSASSSETPSGAESMSRSARTAVEISVAVKDGKVSPKTHREKVAKGSEVRVVITSDVDDEVHVHGYDIEKELSAGQQTTIELTADQTGLFEIETHESGLQLLQLEVK